MTSQLHRHRQCPSMCAHQWLLSHERSMRHAPAERHMHLSTEAQRMRGVHRAPACASQTSWQSD